MKKLTLFFIFLSCFIGNAQLREKKSFELIPEIGYSSSVIYNDTGKHSNSIDSANFGVAGDYYFNNRWSLRSGLLFQTMGGNDSSFTDKLNYLNVPINANWHFGSTRKWNLNFGLTPSFLMSAKENGVDVKQYFQSAQLGLSVGIGYKLEISKKFSLLLDYQDFYGLTNASKVSGFTFRNSCSNFNLGGVYILK